jgi:hypothetical protein
MPGVTRTQCRERSGGGVADALGHRLVPRRQLHQQRPHLRLGPQRLPAAYTSVAVTVHSCHQHRCARWRGATITHAQARQSAGHLVDESRDDKSCTDGHSWLACWARRRPGCLAPPAPGPAHRAHPPAPPPACNYRQHTPSFIHRRVQLTGCRGSPGIMYQSGQRHRQGRTHQQGAEDLWRQQLARDGVAHQGQLRELPQPTHLQHSCREAMNATRKAQLLVAAGRTRATPAAQPPQPGRQDLQAAR